MTDKIIKAIEKWEKGGLNIYYWLNGGDLLEIAVLIEEELKKGDGDG